jgi:hypothetical protein
LFRVGASGVSSASTSGADVSERNDVSGLNPERVSAMTAALVDLRKTFFVNTREGHNCPACPHQGDEANENDEHATKIESCACWLSMNFYKGFFGPYQEVNVPLPPAPGPQPTPPPAPSPPGPKRVAVRHEQPNGSMCIVPKCNGSKCGVVATTCTPTADVWSIEPATGSVRFEGFGRTVPADQNEKLSALCLRMQQPPTLPACCKAGQPLMIGAQACLRTDAGTKSKIVSPDCKGLCAVMAADPPYNVTLGDCNSPLAIGWTTGP